MVYSLGFTLEKVAAMQEHGIKGMLHHLVCRYCANAADAYTTRVVYFKGTWVSKEALH